MWSTAKQIRLPRYQSAKGWRWNLVFIKVRSLARELSTTSLRFVIISRLMTSLTIIYPTTLALCWYYLKILLTISRTTNIQIVMPPPSDHFTVWFIVSPFSLSQIPLEDTTKSLPICKQQRSISMFLMILELAIIADPPWFNAGKIIIVDWTTIEFGILVVECSSAIECGFAPIAFISCLSIGIA